MKKARLVTLLQNALDLMSEELNFTERDEFLDFVKKEIGITTAEMVELEEYDEEEDQ